MYCFSYQNVFDQPLDVNLFIFNKGFTILVLSIVLYMESRLCVLKTNPKPKASEKAIVREKFLLDYLTYSSFVLLKPRLSNLRALKAMWQNSISGLILIITLVWGGFLMNEYYLTHFLSSLTLPYYEKPIKDIPGNQNR